MFSKLSQFTQSLQDELTTPPPGKAAVSSDQVRTLLGKETPPVEEITRPEEVAGVVTENDALLPTTGIPLTALVDVPPEEIRALKQKLSKFQKYDNLYPKLHEAYKVEKKKTAYIAGFEAALKDLTPVESIANVDDLRQYLQGMAKKVDLTNRELASLQKENVQAKDKIKDLETKVKDKGQIEWKLREADVKLRKYDQLEKKVKDLEASQQESKEPQDSAKVKNLEAEMHQLSEAKNLLEKKVADLESEKNTALALKEDALNAVTAEKKIAQEEREKIEYENQEALKELEANLEAKLATSQSTIEELNGKVDDLNKSLTSTSSLTDKFKEKVQDLTKELDTLKASSPSNQVTPGKGSNAKKNKRKNAKPSAVKETMVDATTEPVTNDEVSNTNTSNTDLIELQHSLEQAQAQVTSLSASVKEKCEEIENLKDMLRDVGNSLVEAKDMNKNSEDLQTKLKNKEDELQHMKNDLEMVRVQNSNSLKDYEKTKSSINKKLEANMKLADELQQKLDSSLEKIQILEKENTSLSDKVAKLQASEKELIGTRQSLQKDTGILMEQVEKLKKSQASDARMSTELSNVKSQLTRKEKLLSEAESRIKFLQEEKTKLNDSLIEFKVQSKAIASKEKSFDEFRSNMSELNSKLKKNLTENSIQINKLTLENNQLTKQVEELQEKYNEVKNVKASSSETVDSIKKKLDEVNMTNKELENKIEIISEELNQSRSMLQDRTRESGTMRKILIDNEQTQNTEINNLKAKFDKLLEEKSELEDQSMINLRSKLKEIDELKRAHSNYVAEIDSLNSRNNELESLLKKTSAATSSVSSSPTPTTKNADQSGSQVDVRVLDSLRSSLESTEKKLHELDEMNGKLRKANQESAEKLLWLNKKYKALSQQYKRRVSETDMRSRTGSVISQESTPAGESEADENVKEKAIYIRNVLFGFLEHKEQRQMLLPVIKTLLYMTDDDERKLTTLLA